MPLNLRASTPANLKTLCVPAGDNVPVPCPNVTAEDVTFNLLKDDEVIHNHTCIRDKTSQTCKSQKTRVAVELHGENISVTFMLPGVNASSYGVYRCEGIVMFPPPYKKVSSTVLILVLVEGHQCKFNKDHSKPKTGGDQKDGFLWIWILGLVLLGIYSVTVTVIAGVILVKWRRSDSQSDYMNTKPKAPRDRKKKGWVQHPIPRHF
ncbi:uncharacterized protein LOC115019885 isoform X2 [Cottoperca gobio]|uniref:Uncharacterized protein LOC115019885 isoform X2 n=1 Tax=Cottoperca gobio TaxID=56716 RepID=A0A6J2R7V9_COTGO|nr:uncharacterized protein LOC115019885 isoform X2 [Cottoperca gobio]